MYKNTVAFTLSEVLITLGIIGVIAAMTLPTLIANHKAKVYKNQFKAAQSTLQQIVTFAISDYGGFNEQDAYENKKMFKALFIKRIKGIDCTQFANKNCFDADNPEGYYDAFDGGMKAYRSWFDDGQFIGNNGILFLIEDGGQIDPTTGEEIVAISVDLNSWRKLPNRWGYDLFTFQLKNNRFIPMGSDDSAFPYKNNLNYCMKGKRGIRNGLSCTGRAAIEDDYFEKLFR